MENLNPASGSTGATEIDSALKSPSAPQGATCYYAGQPYSEGAVICQSGHRMRCTNNGVWSDTGESC
jgi:Protein of unknown function (DUF1496)